MELCLYPFLAMGLALVLWASFMPPGYVPKPIRTRRVLILLVLIAVGLVAVSIVLNRPL